MHAHHYTNFTSVFDFQKKKVEQLQKGRNLICFGEKENQCLLRKCFIKIQQDGKNGLLIGRSISAGHSATQDKYKDQNQERKISQRKKKVPKSSKDETIRDGSTQQGEDEGHEEPNCFLLTIRSRSRGDHLHEKRRNETRQRCRSVEEE